jgi:hypothetical protein
MKQYQKWKLGDLYNYNMHIQTETMHDKNTELAGDIKKKVISYRNKCFNKRCGKYIYLLDRDRISYFKSQISRINQNIRDICLKALAYRDDINVQYEVSRKLYDLQSDIEYSDGKLSDMRPYIIAKC